LSYCKTCSGHIKEGDYCSFCGKLYFKRLEVKNTLRKRVEVPKKEKWVPKDIKCRDCKREFTPKMQRQVRCQACIDYIPTNAEKWLNRKEQCTNLSSNQIEYGFFRKKYSVSNRYNACRG